ncbi:hypothetical protein EUGRSUZ_A00441 [Eucalyptus grandis]|uniref:Uncharacterized protein n=2 Tax=Eucalyptus grandis TaxID=71139 RepID=A0ACC3M063_EUCGR|nr:hypothetical protein EUGRSUZ_A00441 [Eucalyptus grandis]
MKAESAEAACSIFQENCHIFPENYMCQSRASSLSLSPRDTHARTHDGEDKLPVQTWGGNSSRRETKFDRHDDETKESDGWMEMLLPLRKFNLRGNLNKLWRWLIGHSGGPTRSRSSGQ